MKILICPDKFKGSLTAHEAAGCIREGIMKVMPDAECKLMPMADGGEGTVDALINATGGRKVTARVHDPLMRLINATYGISGDNTTAFVEMAAASGLSLLAPNERDPMHTTSYGTGELFIHAIEQGVKKIIVGIGGSATIDGGVGMARACGIKFYDDKGIETGAGGKSMKSISMIDISSLDKRIRACEITVACDVRNVLAGKEGAAFVYGRQKGASDADIIELDNGLKHLADLIRRDLKQSVNELPGGGAAGGMGAGIAAFLNGNLKNGFELIADHAGLDEWIRKADLVITGEGKMDEQTMYGKTPAGVASMAKAANKPVLAFAGSLAGKPGTLTNNKGFTTIIPIVDSPMPVEEAMKRAGELLRNAAERSFTLIHLFKPS